MNKIKLALIGAGQRGYLVYSTYVKNNAHDLEYVALAEPNRANREIFLKDFPLPPENIFEDAQDLLAGPKLADAVLICNQDQDHYAAAKAAIRKGYHILLEKPISPNMAESYELEELARTHGTIILVCHVLRYTSFFRKIKQILVNGEMGQIVNINHTENVGYWHQAHSFVRGNWSKTASSSPMILAKCCHDMDILCWLIGSRCQSVSSFGSLAYFKPEHAPDGAPDRCMDGCPHADTCPYYAPALYLSQETGWPVSAISPDSCLEARTNAIQQGPYGRCVFRAGNDVVDHQVANLLFHNGVVVSFTMSAFNGVGDRTMRIMCTRGEIRASMAKDEIEVTLFGQGKNTGTTCVYKVKSGSAGHGGGDVSIMRDFVRLLRSNQCPDNIFSDSVHSHAIALACEQSRLENRTVDMASFEQQYR